MWVKSARTHVTLNLTQTTWIPNLTQEKVIGQILRGRKRLDKKAILNYQSEKGSKDTNRQTEISTHTQRERERERERERGKGMIQLF